MTEKKNDGKSLAMLIVSMLIFGTVGIFRRYISLSSAMLAFSRGLAGTLFLLFVIGITKRREALSGLRGKFFLLVLSGALIGLNWILLFEAYNYTTVATATLCYYMEPTIVILASAVIFREKLTPKKLVLAGLALLGMVLVSGITEGTLAGTSDGKGILLGLGAAALYSSVVLLNKKFSEIDAYGKTLVQLASAAMVLVPYLFLTGGFSDLPSDPGIWGLTLFMGLVHTGLAYVLYFGSMKGLKTQTVAVFSYLDPVTALVLSAAVLGETPNITGAIGAVLILGAAVLMY